MFFFNLLIKKHQKSTPSVYKLFNLLLIIYSFHSEPFSATEQFNMD